MSKYLHMALTRDDISGHQFVNVIRIYLGKTVLLHNGVDGDGHYATIAKQERNKLKNLEIEPDDYSPSEEQEISDIIEEYKCKI